MEQPDAVLGAPCVCWGTAALIWREDGVVLTLSAVSPLRAVHVD